MIAAAVLYAVTGLLIIGGAAAAMPRWVWLAMWRWALARCSDRRGPAACLLSFLLVGVVLYWALAWPALLLWIWWLWRS